MSLPIMSMVNGSCVFKKSDKHVVSFYNDQVILDDRAEFPHETTLVRANKKNLLFGRDSF